MKTNNLKPCPLCGSTNIHAINDTASPMKFCRVHCQDCGISWHTFIDGTFDRWNTRPIEDGLQARIAELEAEHRWIPVSERMPDDWESVLTIDISKSTQDVVTAFYNPEMSLWSTHFSYDLWVTHWMRLPEPPIVYGKVCEE